MKTKLLLAVSTALVCAALAVFVSGKISDNNVSSFATENVEALSAGELIKLGPGWYVYTEMRNNPAASEGCEAAPGCLCELRR